MALTYPQLLNPQDPNDVGAIQPGGVPTGAPNMQPQAYGAAGMAANQAAAQTGATQLPPPQNFYGQTGLPGNMGSGTNPQSQQLAGWQQYNQDPNNPNAHNVQQQPATNQGQMKAAGALNSIGQNFAASEQAKNENIFNTVFGNKTLPAQVNVGAPSPMNIAAGNQMANPAGITGTVSDRRAKINIRPALSPLQNFLNELTRIR